MIKSFSPKENMTQPFTTDSSITTTLKALQDAHPIVSAAHDLRAVVIGGGTGAPVSILTLLSMGLSTSAVVAMADDGGSTGILRTEAKVTPPGDVRKCIAAFAGNQKDPMTKAFRYRFEFARNHTLGNLMLSALEEATGSFLEAINICEEMLEVRGHVYPSTLDLVTLLAQTKEGEILRGQAIASKSNEPLEKVWLESVQDCEPCKFAIEAIRDADLIVLGPGSLFTSIIPNLLVPGIVEAIAESKGKTVFVCSLADMQGETWGLSAREHIEALYAHGMRGLLDFALIHSPTPLQPDNLQANSLSFQQQGSGGKVLSQTENPASSFPPVQISYQDLMAIRTQGTRAIVSDMVDSNRPTWHDPHALRSALRKIMEECHLPLT